MTKLQRAAVRLLNYANHTDRCSRIVKADDDCPCGFRSAVTQHARALNGDPLDLSYTQADHDRAFAALSKMWKDAEKVDPAD